eukprot:GHVR01009852.1.p1 GENE.GHVR01009852.1~~GHVR01009852.1.p1  ORF type:complete len:442 (+),score=117.29 GHVR01009852.1:545-1870(+)
MLSEIVKEDDDVGVVVAVDNEDNILPSACAVARLVPSYQSKTIPVTAEDNSCDKKNKKDKSQEKFNRVRLCFVNSTGKLISSLQCTAHVVSAVRTAARIVDTPPDVMNVNQFVQEACDVVTRLKHSGKTATMTLIRGDELRDQGFGGLWNVGRAACQQPALVVLSYQPSDFDVHTPSVSLVGKGIVYDSGGLSIKINGNMIGMKIDCAGAAATLASFEAAVAAGVCDANNERRSGMSLNALLCLAENAVGPSSYRNDDIITLYSQKTVEINNTDAEGRLVLSDGVAYATRHLSPDVLLDIATLTGAQLFATGKRTAAVLCNSESLEAAIVTAGRQSGDLCHPLAYQPEILLSEFASKVADMKNSVKDNRNAPSVCAGLFVGESIVYGSEHGKDGASDKLEWVHVDMAGPAQIDDRATGYGVALIYSLLETYPQKKISWTAK